MTRRHGPSGYTGGCRCETCKAGKRDLLRHRRRMKAYGRPITDLVDVGPARDHLKKLLAAGVSLDKICEESGVSYGALSRTLYLGQKRMKSASSEAILALTSVDTSESLSVVDPAGTRRRVQALAVLGWSVAWQARQIGMFPTDLHTVARADGGVTARTASRIRDLYEQHWNVTPPASQPTSVTRNAAVRRGWLPPMAWDDDLIDLPDADLEAELSRRVAAMDLTELHRCYRAHNEWGDRSPLIVAGAKAFPRRRREAARQKQTAA